MQINSVEFIKSSPDVKACPSSSLPEYAFVGRSNVGKSSLINMLVNRRNLAKTSSTPGKTRLINHFLINEEWYLVDLPGYGYARTGKKIQGSFIKTFTEYVLTRETLSCLFLLIDCRHKPLANDVETINWLGSNQIPFALVFTKTDKISPNAANGNVLNYNNLLTQTWEELPDIFLSSAVSGTGREEIFKFIENANKLFAK